MSARPLFRGECMYMHLRGNVEYCVAAGEVVLLDLERGRYSTLTPDCRNAFLRLVKGRGLVDEADRQTLEALRRPGYLIEGAQSVWANGVMALDVAQDDFDLPDGLKVRAPLLVHVIFSQWVLATHLRIFSLSAVLKYVRRSKKGLSIRTTDSDRIIQSVVNAFEMSSFLLGRTDRCLVRSLAMFMMLQRRGVSSRLIFGVRADPFAAHCWVERNGAVLNDVAENVRCFTPIMVLP